MPVKENIILFLCVFLFFSCSQKKDTTLYSDPGKPGYGDTIITASLGEPSNLIPILSSDSASHDVASFSVPKKQTQSNHVSNERNGLHGNGDRKPRIQLRSWLPPWNSIPGKFPFSFREYFWRFEAVFQTVSHYGMRRSENRIHSIDHIRCPTLGKRRDY